MISEHFINPSAMGWLRLSPDGRYLAIGGPGAAFRLYKNNDNLLLRASIPFDLEIEDVAFRVVDDVTLAIALLAYGPDPSLHFIDLTALSSQPVLRVPGASAINFSIDGGTFRIALENGVILEFAVNQSGWIDSVDGVAVFEKRHTLPSDARVVKLLSAEARNLFFAYNDHSQLYFVDSNSSEAEELSAYERNPFGFRLIRHHPQMALLAAVRWDGTLFVQDSSRGLNFELALVDGNKDVVSLSFSPDGDIVVASETEVMGVRLIAAGTSGDSGEAAAARVESYELYRCAKPIVLAELSPVSGSLTVLHA